MLPRPASEPGRLMNREELQAAIAKFESTWIGKETIRVQVGYYDEHEQHKLDAYPSAAAIREMVTGGAQIPVSEFLTYYLFHRKRPGKPGYRSYSELSTQIHKAIAELDGWIDHNGVSICASVGTSPFNNPVSERVGEALALPIVGRLHGLTEADWDKIREGRGKTFDYEVASDGTRVIEVEAKGSCIDINDGHRPNAISKHKQNLDRKKANVAERLASAGKAYADAVRYGVIGSIDRRPEGIARCLLTDPPADPLSRSARSIRLLNRMGYIRDQIQFIAPHSHLATAMNTRMGALETLEDPLQLNDVPLVKASGEPFSFSEYGRDWRHSTFMANRPHVEDGPVGGTIVGLGGHELFFYGFQERLLTLAAEQRFDELESYNFGTAAVAKVVRCIVGVREAERLDLPDDLRLKSPTGSGRVEFDAAGTLLYSRGGVVFGIVRPQEGRRALRPYRRRRSRWTFE
jgi:hypothetical protein